MHRHKVTQILCLIYFIGYCRCYFRCRRCCGPSWPTTTSTIPCSSSSSIQASSIRKSSWKAPTPTFCLWIWCKGRLLWRWLRQERKPRCQRKRCWILRCPSSWWPCPNCNLHRWSLQRLRSWCQVRRYVIPKGFYKQKSSMFNILISSLSLSNRYNFSLQESHNTHQNQKEDMDTQLQLTSQPQFTSQLQFTSQPPKYFDLSTLS